MPDGSYLFFIIRNLFLHMANFSAWVNEHEGNFVKSEAIHFFCEGNALRISAV